MKTDISKWNKEEYGKVEVRASKALNLLPILEQATEGRMKTQGKISHYESQIGNSEGGQSRRGLVEIQVQIFLVERG